MYPICIFSSVSTEPEHSSLVFWSVQRGVVEVYGSWKKCKGIVSVCACVRVVHDVVLQFSVVVRSVPGNNAILQYYPVVLTSVVEFTVCVGSLKETTRTMQARRGTPDISSTRFCLSVVRGVFLPSTTFTLKQFEWSSPRYSPTMYAIT